MGFEGIGQDIGRGHNITTYSGEPFWPMDPKPEDIRIDDIAHSLAMQCRFNGHCKWPYSVAQHSVIMASTCVRYGRKEHAFEALMHDATEAYIGDMIRPLKAHIPQFIEIEEKIDRVIRSRFGLPEAMTPIVKEYDMRMAVTEKRDILKPSPNVDWGNVPEPFDFSIVPVSWAEAREMFLEWFGFLCPEEYK